MTNAEKYLKDGVDIGQLAREITELNWSNDDCLEDNITMYFRQKVKPTLTEDEKVILRNIDTKYKYIGRNGKPSHIYLNDFQYYSDIQGYYPAPFFDHLFQSIKNGEEYLIEELLKGE